jgi:hypothetical protein
VSDHYCTISDVNSYVPQSPFTPTTTPTAAQVQAYIAQVATQLDLTLMNLGYPTPVVTGAMSLAELRKVNAWGALGLAQQSRITAIAPDQAVGLSVWTKMLNDWLKALADPNNPYELSDAPRSGRAVVKPVGEVMDGPLQASVDSGTAQDPYGYISTPPFYMGQKF